MELLHAGKPGDVGHQPADDTAYAQHEEHHRPVEEVRALSEANDEQGAERTHEAGGCIGDFMMSAGIRCALRRAVSDDAGG